jgi:hypothetical protein
MVFKATISVQARLLNSMLQVCATDKDPRELLRGIIVVLRKDEKPFLMATDGKLLVSREADYFGDVPEIPENTETIRGDCGLAVTIAAADIKQVLSFYRSAFSVNIEIEYDRARGNGRAYWSASAGNGVLRFPCISNGRLLPNIFFTLDGMKKSKGVPQQRISISVEVMQRFLNAAKKIGASAIDLSSEDFDAGKPYNGEFIFQGSGDKGIDGVEGVEIYYMPLKLKRDEEPA